jgi:hypothetical protein
MRATYGTLAPPIRPTLCNALLRPLLTTCIVHAVVDLVWWARSGPPPYRHTKCQMSCNCGPRGGQQVLFRPLTKLRVVTAVKNIIDPAERTRVDKSGFPDTVVLVQISEAEDVAAPAPATVATASASEQNKALEKGHTATAKALQAAATPTPHAGAPATAPAVTVMQVPSDRSH